MTGSANLKTNQKKCIKCEEYRNRTVNFYVSYSKMHTDGRVPVCKTCLESMFDVNDMENSLNELLRQIDKPYIYHLLDSSIEENPSNIFGAYMKNVAMRQYRGLTWKDSAYRDSRRSEEDVLIHSNRTNPERYQPTDEILQKWGYGFENEEYFYFEKKYDSMKNNYPQRTAMHTEALLNYIRYQVKAELATAKGDVKAAKDWGGLAKTAADAAKINPSQLSKADLSDGMDSFSQLVRSVEQAVDIIEILPRFKQRPKDKVDFTIWAYVNYVRDLKGLPPAKYEDIYKFYEERKKEYEKMIEVDDDGNI